MSNYILSAENFIFIDFFAVKVDGSDINPGICNEFSYRRHFRQL